MAFPLGRQPFPYDPIDDSGEPVVRIGLSQFRPSKITDPAIYNNAMEGGLFEGYEGPPGRPGSGQWAPPPSESAGVAWDARYKDGHIGPDGFFDYGPRYHGPDEWVKYTRWIEMPVLVQYNPVTERFEQIGGPQPPGRGRRTPPVPLL